MGMRKSLRGSHRKISQEKTCSQWEICIPFTEEFDLLDGWNGEYRKEGSTLIIVSKDYNGIIEPDQTVTDIGFIIKGNQGLAVKE